jgi:hypothetical protein
VSWVEGHRRVGARDLAAALAEAPLARAVMAQIAAGRLPLNGP